MRCTTILLLLLILQACSKQEEEQASVIPINKPPIADAGPDSTIYYPEKTIYFLNARKSFDPDGDSRTLQFSWKQLSGPTTVIGQAVTPYASFDILDTGRYVFTLRVTDEKQAVSTDTLTITVKWGIGCSQTSLAGTPQYEPEYMFQDVMPFDFAMASAADILVMAGGYYTINQSWDVKSSPFFWIYNMQSKTMEKRNLSVARGEIGLAVNDTWIVIAGGYHGSAPIDNVELYNMATRETRLLKLSSPRSNVKVAISGERVLFCGGIDGSGFPSPDVDIYNIRTGSWTKHLISPRQSPTITFAGSYVFLTGGIDANGQGSNVMDVYDTQTGIWGTRQMVNGRYNHAATMVNNQLIISGGWLDYDYPHTKGEIFDISSNSSSITCQLASYSYGINAHLIAALADKSYYYLAGGFLCKRDLNSNVWTIGRLRIDENIANLISAGNKLLGLRILSSEQTAEGTGQKIGLVRLQL